VLARAGGDPGSDPGPEGLAGAYVRLALRLDRVLPGVVDAHLGDPAEASRVLAEPRPRPADLAVEADRLRTALPDAGLGPARTAFLDAQLGAVRLLAERAGGREVGFVEEVERCFGVRIGRGEPDRYRDAHRALDALLPGPGPLPERLAAFRDRDRLAPEHLPTALAAAVDALRERTATALGLPAGEDVTLEVVDAAPWSGFSRWLGPRRSAIAVNGGIPHRVTHLALLVAHEAYPGHHTEHTRKEVGLVRRRNHLEETIFLVGTPQCLVAEGLADLGLEVLLGRRPEPVLREHLAPLGIRYDAEVVAAVAVAAEALSAVRGNVALLLNDQGADADDAVAYLERWSLLPRNRAEKAVQFLTDPTWRAYISCYVEGLPLCRSFVGGDPARFERLLSDQLTPADLRVAA
jgi:hypothetical protein